MIERKIEPNFFIFGYFGWYNSGDDAIGYSVLKELGSRYPLAKFSISFNNDYFKHYDFTHKIATRIFFNYISIFKAILKCDRFFITGGTQFHDDDANLLRRLKLHILFACMIILSRALGKRPILLGHGIGPISKKWTKFLLKIIFIYSSIILVRDLDSYNLVKSLGYGKKCALGFDCAAILIDCIISGKKKDKKTIGVSVFPAFSIYSYDISKDDTFLIQLKNCFRFLFENQKNIKLKLFAFNGLVDQPFVTELSRQLGKYRDDIQIVCYDGNLLNFLSEVKDCDLFIGMKYHSSLFAYLFGMPFIIIEYMGKCRSLANAITHSNDAVIHLQELNEYVLYDKLERMISNPKDFIAKLPIEEAITSTKDMFAYLDDLL
jgi:polysaccharide pyruvyl transferase WcaK-like protein